MTQFRRQMREIDEPELPYAEASQVARIANIDYDLRYQVICGIDPGWPHLSRFSPIIKRAISEFGTNITLYLAVTTLLKRGVSDLLPDPALGWLHGIVVDRKADQKFCQMNGENTVELLKLLIAQKGNMLATENNKLIMLIADILVDNGVRGAGFLQQELLRAS
jgi:hypothetical protein